MKRRVLFAVFGLMLAGSNLPAQEYKPEALAQAKLGVSLSQKEKYREAIQAYQRAIAIEPKLPGIYLNLGLAWFKLGNFREAISAFEKEKENPRSERLETLLAMSYFGLGQYRQAADLLKPIAAAQPENAELGYLLAKCYLWSGQTGEAMDLFKVLLQRDPNSVTVHMLLGEALDARAPHAGCHRGVRSSREGRSELSRTFILGSVTCIGNKSAMRMPSASFGKN